jgi:hypothetical protein
MSLSTLAFAEGRRRALEGEEPFVSEGPAAVRLQPDHHLLCFDFVYFAGILEPWEWAQPYFLPWTKAGTHVHWAPRMTALAQEYLVRLFNVPSKDDIPKVRGFVECRRLQR